jgi:hypothetical protein
MVFLRFLWMVISFLLVEVSIFLPLYILGIPVAYCAGRWAKSNVVPSRLPRTARSWPMQTRSWTPGWGTTRMDMPRCSSGGTGPPSSGSCGTL